MPKLTEKEWYLVKWACRCLWDSLDITNTEIKDRNPDLYKVNQEDMKTLDRIMTKISGDKRK